MSRQTDTFVPNKPNTKKYTKFQQQLLDTVLTEFNGDVMAAAKATGHKVPRDLIETVKEELIEIANSVMAMHAIKAAVKLGEVMDSETPIVQVEGKLKAAQMILDRTNPKTEKVDLSGEVKTGLIILPAKRAVEEDE